MSENEICTIILDSAFKIHRKLGPGLFESDYKECLLYELVKSNIKVLPEKAIPLIYEDVKMDIGFRADLLVENKVVVEIKSIEGLHDVHKKQLLTYIRLADCKLGLLINFNELLLKDGIKRVVNNLKKKFHAASAANRSVRREKQI